MAKRKQPLSEQPSFIDPLKEIIVDSLEAIMDTKSEDGLLKDLPVIGLTVKAYKAFKGIKDRIFLKKLKRFFDELDSTTEEERHRFWAAYEGDSQERQKLGDQLVIYLDRQDNVDKSALLARAFGAYIRGKIEYIDFLDLAILIDSIKVHHLETVISILILTGSSSFYSELNLTIDYDRFVPEMEAKGLFDREETIKTRKDYDGNTEIVHMRKFKTTPLARYFLEFVMPEMAREVTEKINAFYSEKNEAYVERERIREADQLREYNLKNGK